jgi:histidinol-phosphate aminotransferase
MSTAEHPVHGGLDPGELAALGLDPKGILDFSANVNPLGPSPRVWEALAGVDIAAYPDRECRALRQALSVWLGVGPDAILVGNGSTELVHLLARALLHPGESVVVLAPTFGEYEAAARLAGAAVQEVRAEEEAAFQWDVEAAARLVANVRPRLVFLCNPNNPTGVYLAKGAVARIAGAMGDEALLVVDEAYIAFVEGAWDSRALLQRPNIVLLRSMTKDYALAGLRLGYALGPPPVVETLRRHQPSWSVNGAAQMAGLAALADPGHLDRAREEVRRGKAYLLAELGALGLRAIPSAANFLLVKVVDAARRRRQLLKRGVCVRDCTSFGLPDHMRIAVRTVSECQTLIAALREVLARG